MNYLMYMDHGFSYKTVILNINGVTHTVKAQYFLAHDLQHLIHGVGFSNEEEAFIQSSAMKWPINNAGHGVSAERFYCAAYPQLDCSVFSALCNDENEVDVPNGGVMFYFVGDTLRVEHM